jgi:ribosomal-protein-alanine N-acetyltransferase
VPQFRRLEATTNSSGTTPDILPLEREDLAEAGRIFAACGETELASTELEQSFDKGELFNDEAQSFALRLDDAPAGIAVVAGIEQPIIQTKLYLSREAANDAALADGAVRWLADCYFSMRWYAVAMRFTLPPAGGAAEREIEITRADWEGWDHHPVRDDIKEVRSSGAPLAASQITYEPLTEDSIPFLQRIMLSSFEFYNFRPTNRQRLEHSFREGKFFGNANRYFIIHAEGEPIGVLRAEDIMRSAPEVGLRMLGPWQSRGVGIHATQFIVDYVFTELPRPAHKVRALTAADNTGGNKALRKFGFTLEGISRQQWYIRGRWRDAALYSLLRSEWEQLS